MTLTIGAEHGSDEWHDQRRGICTASTVGRLITQRHLTAIDYGCPECGAAANAPCLSRRVGVQATIKTLHTARTAVAAMHRDDTPPQLEVADNDDSRGLTATLVAERITGWTEPTYLNSDMIRGLDCEPIARPGSFDVWEAAAQEQDEIAAESIAALGMRAVVAVSA